MSVLAPPAGIEPAPTVPETVVLSIKLWRRLFSVIIIAELLIQKQKHAVKPLGDSIYPNKNAVHARTKTNKNRSII